MIVAYIDGGARGNPGPAGFGVRIELADGSLVEEFSESIGVATNNVAEYRGLLAVLEWAKRRGEHDLLVRSDSLLLVQQMKGVFKVKNAGLQPLYGKARVLVHDVGRVTFEHVGRALNAHADRLANAAMDGAQGKPPVDDHPFSALERAVRLQVYRTFVQRGRAPSLRDIAANVDATERAVGAALRTLADAHALVLAPSTVNVWMAHPFSALPTAYLVTANGKTYWANCAWDALGILSLVGDGDTRTRCADCGAELSLEVHGGALATGGGVVHFAVPPRLFWDNIAFT